MQIAHACVNENALCASLRLHVVGQCVPPPICRTPLRTTPPCLLLWVKSPKGRSRLLQHTQRILVCSLGHAHKAISSHQTIGRVAPTPWLCNPDPIVLPLTLADVQDDRGGAAHLMAPPDVELLTRPSALFPTKVVAQMDIVTSFPTSGGSGTRCTVNHGSSTASK